MRHSKNAVVRKPQIRWDADKRRFIEQNYPSMTLPVLTAAFNDAFGTEVTEGAVGQKLHELRIKKKPSRGD